MKRYRSAFFAGWLLAATYVSTAWAGPPFRTDDPVPTDYHQWEVYGFSEGTHKHGDTSGSLLGLDANYGLAPNLQFHAGLPLAFDKPSGSGTKIGYGDTEIGLKYRFVEETEDGWWPQVAIYPIVEAPTGNESRGLGTGHTHEFLPLWLQKSFGEWTSYAGGGYWNNPGAGNRNHWFAGWALQRHVTQDLTLGGELFYQTQDTDTAKDSTGFNLGAIYDLSDSYHLLFSAGKGIHNVSTTNEFSYYVALQWTFSD